MPLSNSSDRLKTIVVVAPRILLANQLCEEFLEFIDDVDVLHVHSGETHHDSTTNSLKIEEWHWASKKHQLDIHYISFFTQDTGSNCYACRYCIF